ncbi:MAG: DUF2804 domain-containing protein [Treponema sp.]|jgi:hypothetical protein|nr:DUF2804 domain-containing protein [Treponema sp.]
MYTREIQIPRSSPIENGKPLPGTWTRAFDEVDLLNIQHPFPFPVPRWARDYRIKEWESFTIQDDHFFLAALLFNFKYFREAWVHVYDKTSTERMWFKKLLPFSGWRLPKKLSNASIESRSYGFFFRIHDWLDANTIEVDLDIEATRKRPSFTAHLHYSLAKKAVTPMVVNLLFSERCSLYMFKALGAVRGDMVFGGRHISLNPDKTTGLFCDCKGFYPFRTHSWWCNGFGFDGKNRRIGFSIAENQTKETYKNNENALWVDGKLTPLPPVKITMPGGIESDWIIQDLEGMVDLTFSPRESFKDAVNMIVLLAEYDAPLGFYNGMLVTSTGEKIPVHNLWGIGEKFYMRI